MPPLLPTLGPDGSGSSSVGGAFGSPAARDAISRPLEAPGFVEAASEQLLRPRAVADTGLSPSPSATFAAGRDQFVPPKAESTQAANTGQVASPLGGLFESLTDVFITQPSQRFQRGFIDDAGVQSRAAQLAQEAFSTLPMEIDQVDDATIASINEDAMKQARAEANQQNADAFNTVVGSSIVGNATQAALTLNALDNQIDAQVKQMQRDTERFINGVEFNSRMRERASNLVQMRENLRTIDSIMTQAESAIAGPQRQLFLRNPVGGRRV